MAPLSILPLLPALGELELVSFAVEKSDVEIYLRTQRPAVVCPCVGRAFAGYTVATRARSRICPGMVVPSIFSSKHGDSSVIPPSALAASSPSGCPRLQSTTPDAPYVSRPLSMPSLSHSVMRLLLASPGVLA